MKELTVEATVESIPVITEFVDGQLEQFDCPMKAQAQIDIAIDELFSNIVHYAYYPGTGPATVRVEVMEEPLSVVITFIDQGVPYDPLAKADPDVTFVRGREGCRRTWYLHCKEKYERDYLRV